MAQDTDEPALGRVSHLAAFTFGIYETGSRAIARQSPIAGLPTWRVKVRRCRSRR